MSSIFFKKKYIKEYFLKLLLRYISRVAIFEVFHQLSALLHLEHGTSLWALLHEWYLVCLHNKILLCILAIALEMTSDDKIKNIRIRMCDINLTISKSLTIPFSLFSSIAANFKRSIFWISAASWSIKSARAANRAGSEYPALLIFSVSCSLQSLFFRVKMERKKIHRYYFLIRYTEFRNLWKFWDEFCSQFPSFFFYLQVLFFVFLSIKDDLEFSFKKKLA